MFQTKTNFKKRLLSLLMSIAMTLTMLAITPVILPQKAEAFDYGDPVYLEFYFDSRSWSSVSNARVALDCTDPGGFYHPPYNSLHTAARAPSTELFRLKDPNKPLLGGLQQMYNADDIITTYTSYSDRLIIPTYMNYIDFIAAFNYMYGVLDWSKVDYQKIIMPNAYTYTIAGGGNARHDKVTFPQDRDSPWTYPGDPHQIVWVTAVSQKQNALSMTVKSKPSLQLDYEGASYAIGVSGHNSWDISAVITNTASYPVYVRPDVKYYLQESDGTETPVATDGYYYDPDNSTNQIIAGSLYGYGPGDILMIPPGGQYEYTPTPFVNPPTSDKTIRAEVTVENLTSVQPEFVTGSTTTLFPKATGVKNGLKLTGVYPTEVKEDEVFTATLFGINFNKIDLMSFTAYDSDTQPSSAATDITTAPIEAEFINQTEERIDIVFPNGLPEGNYVFSFKDKETTPNDYYFRIEASPTHETPVWPVYGILSVHQPSSLFDVFGSGSEEELRILPANPLLTFRGMVKQNSDTEYMIADGATINGTLQFRCQDSVETNNFLKVTTGAASNSTWVTIESLSNEAVLLYDGTVVAKGEFKIELVSSNKYSISRTPGAGETKVALSYATPGTFFEFDSYGVEIHAGGLIIYQDTVGISGQVCLSEVIPGFIKQYFFNVLFDLEELQLSRYAPPSIKAGGEFHVGTIFDIIEASANMEFSMNTLPEVEGTSEQHIYMKGDVTIFDYIQLMGELRLEAARGIYLPERFEFWARGGSLGVPLIPALTLATINGFGGGFQGLASTIDNRFNYIPNLALIFSGSIADITDQLISLSKSSITVGLRGVEGRADSVKVLGMDILKNINYYVLLTDQLYSLNIGGGTLSVPGVEVTLKGGFELPFEFLTAYGSVMVGVYPNFNLDAFVSKISNFDTSAIWDVLDMFEFRATAKGEAKIPNFIPAPIGGATIATASAEMTKYRISVRGSLPGLGFGEVGVYMDFPYKDQEIGFGLLSFDPSADDGTIKTTVTDENGDEYTFTMMNVRRPTVVNSSRSITKLAGVPSGGSAFSKTVLPLFDIVGTTPNSMTVNVDASDPCLVFSLETSTAGPVSYTVTGPSSFMDTVNTDTSDTSKWYIAEDEEGNMVYRHLHEIVAPASGDWTMTVNSSAGSVAIDALVIDPLPEIDSVAYSAGNVTLALSNMDTAKDYTVDLFAVEDDADAENNIGQFLASVEFSGAATTLTEAVTMPKDLPSGNYLIRAMLCEKDGDDLSPLCSALSSAAFTHTNSYAPGDVSGLSVTPNGNGTVKVSWVAPSGGADGYIITVLDGGLPVTDSAGNEGQPIVISDSAATEYILQGGKIAVDDGIVTGYEYAHDYTISISAFNEVNIGSVPTLGEGGEITSASTPVTARVSSSAVNSILRFTAPTPPSFGISFTGADETVTSTVDLPVYIGQAPVATVEVPAGCSADIICNGDPYPGTPFTTDILCDLAADDDGTYTYVVTVTNTSSLDSSEKRFVLIKDTTPPVLQIDGSGAILSSDGIISFSGNTDPDASLNLNGGVSGFDRDGGLFSFSGAVSGDSITLTATDDAGNQSVLTRQLITQNSDIVSISVSTAVGGVIPIALTPKAKLAVTALTLSGGEITLSLTDPKLILTVTGDAATVATDGTITPISTGLITISATYTDEYGRLFTAGGAYEIVDALPIRDLAYSPTGTNGANLTFTPPTGTASVKLQYSTDDTNWSDYLQGTLNASGGTAILSSLAYDTTHYFRVLVSGGLNDGPSNSVAIIRMKPSTSSPPTVPGDSGSYVSAPTGAANAVASDNMSKITDLGGGVSLYTPEGQDPAIGDDGSMTLPGGGTITTPGDGATPPSEEGGSQGGVTIIVPPGTVIDKDGKISFPNGSGGAVITYPNGFTFNVLEGVVILLDGNVPLGYYVDAENPFTDVKGSDWFLNSVLFAYSHGLMNGIAPDKFSPNTPITRAMVVTVLYRMASGANSEFGIRNSEFKDVDEGMWYTDAVVWAAVNGIVNGYGNGMFGPDDPITRQDLAVILMRYANYMGIQLPPNSSLQTPNFIDDADIADYAKEAIERFFEAGIINGYPDGGFKPRGQATRAEFAAMLMRFIESAE